jgi:hypothetical protein
MAAAIPAGGWPPVPPILKTRRPPMLISVTAVFLFTAMLVWGQTNNVAVTNHPAEIAEAPAGEVAGPAGQSRARVPALEAIRADCIQKRRMVCGRILQVLPEGLVVESGYLDLLQRPLGRSWLVTGTVLAGRTPNLVEGKEPGAVCAGLVFLTDYPKSRRTKPKPFDYVILTGYPAGQYTYTPVGTLQRTVRRFSASLSAAVSLNYLAGTNAAPARAAGVK